MTQTTPPHEFDDDGIDLEGPVTERSARLLLREVKQYRKGTILATAASVVALIAASFSGYGLWRQNEDRCQAANQRSAIIVANNTGAVEYLDDYALAVGVDPNFDVTKLPEDQRAAAQATIDRIKRARKKQLDRNNDPSLKIRKC